MPSLPLLIARDHPAYAGHFPGRPILPGVVLLDQAQAAIERVTGVRVSGISVAKFLSPALPGEALELSYELAGDGTFVSVEIRCGERKVASGRFTLSAGGP